MNPFVSGFSKLTNAEKLDWLATHYTAQPEHAKELLRSYHHRDEEVQRKHEEFVENTISNFFLPYSIAPNFLVNGTLLAFPMVIEESSVVAAASRAAKYWYERGGFQAEIQGRDKIGQVHLLYRGHPHSLENYFNWVHPRMLEEVEDLTRNMRKRGGGIQSIELVDSRLELDNYFQLHAVFHTSDAMGANFINSCLEQFADTFVRHSEEFTEWNGPERPEVVMSILSNYVPNCRVRAEVLCPVADLMEDPGESKKFASKFVQAIQIANAEPHRAVTHNKGIMNGVDALLLATGNDFRAVSAGVHAYASHSGSYKSLTHAEVHDGNFHFWIELPLAVGTVGGLTGLHPLVKLSLEILQNPSADELMQYLAVAGLAQNFGALSSLVTHGIQKGHMRMHLQNILNQVGATSGEKVKLLQAFKEKTVSVAAVKQALKELRS